ncbi:MAG: hypothetical protein RL701_3436 [Pseudomonadota bacterium]|jgi:DNA-binding transcriptional MocR family regulator
MSSVVLSERIVRLKSSMVRDILAAAQAPSVISFAGGLPAAEVIPRLRGLDVPAEFCQYGATEGEPQLRALISAELRARGLVCPAERILILSGSQQGIDLVSKLFIDIGSAVLAEEPTYLAALQVFQLLGARIHGLPLSRSGVDTTQLAQLAQRTQPRFAYFVPTFQNPTGFTHEHDARRAIARVLDQANVPLFEDDPYRELAFDGPAPIPIAAHMQQSPWVYQSSFSKMFMPGIRLGFLAASPELFAPLVRLKQAADLHANRISQWLAVRDLLDPARPQRLAQLREHYRDKRDAFERALRVHLGALADWSLPSGGLFFWLRLKQPRDLIALLPRALAQGVAFVPGDAFFSSDHPPRGYLRLNFSHAPPELVDEGLSRLSTLLRTH